MIEKVKKALDTYTAYELAKVSGVSPQSLQKYKNGEAEIENMRLGTAIELIDFLNKKEGNKMEKVSVKFEGKLINGDILEVAEKVISEIGDRYTNEGKSEYFDEYFGNLVGMEEEVEAYYRVIKDLNFLEIEDKYINMVDLDIFIQDKLNKELKTEVKKRGVNIFNSIGNEFDVKIEVLED